MITAIQDLIECIRFTDKECYATMFNEGIFDKSLEKEKEQIIDAHLEGWSDAYDYIYSDSNQQARQAADYYNETYNQNKS